LTKLGRGVAGPRLHWIQRLGTQHLPETTDERHAGYPTHVMECFKAVAARIRPVSQSRDPRVGLSRSLADWGRAPPKPSIISARA
jgi:hypothetical protein